MKIKVMSLSQVIEFSKQNNQDSYALISIRGYMDPKPKLEKNSTIKDKLFLMFDDIDYNIEKPPSENLRCISEKQANQIVDFISKNKDNVDTIIVNCMAGKSRSAGVAAAILKFYHNDDTPIFNNNKYIPNMTCYRTVLNAFFEKFVSNLSS